MFASLETPRNSWALQACQLWELLHDAQLLCRSLQLRHVTEVQRVALAPPHVVAVRRRAAQAVLEQAPAVLLQAEHAADPAIQLLFRDFCEVLVRVAVLRYPQLPRPELALATVLEQHLLPLLRAVHRLGSNRERAGSATARGVEECGVLCMASTAAPTTQQQQDKLVLYQYLQSQARGLQALFLACVAAHPVCQAGGEQDIMHSTLYTAPSADWRSAQATPRQVIFVLQDSGLLRTWGLESVSVVQQLIAGVLGARDPEAPR